MGSVAWDLVESPAAARFLEALPEAAASLPSDEPGLRAWAASTRTLVATLPSSLGFPVLRRAIVAALVKAWLRAHGSGGGEGGEGGVPKEGRAPWGDECAADVMGLLVELHSAHARGVSTRGMLEFLHVSKAGGTSTCMAAGANGCVTEVGGFDSRVNCLVDRFDDGPRWLSSGGVEIGVKNWERGRRKQGYQSCAARVARMRRDRFNFYANEYTVHSGAPSEGESRACAGGEGVKRVPHPAGDRGDVCPPHVCKELANMVVLRDPVKRAASHVKYILEVSHVHWARLNPEAFASWWAEHATAEQWAEFAPAILDNYYTRVLGGEEVFALPSGSLDERHARTAQVVLLQYDFIVVLEAGGTGVAGDPGASAPARALERERRHARALSGSGGTGSAGGPGAPAPARALARERRRRARALLGTGSGVSPEVAAAQTEYAGVAWAAALGWNVTMYHQVGAGV
ncbi:hypothetical protein FOA52_009000 [Chlamydomonas sp. UWO 241]|nr:hypothetical protein FOA52_009000 [Chlamydomonas sp. UWO 241]